MAPGSKPLSEDQLRRTWSLVDVLTMLKRRANHPPPTAELIRRKFDALSLPALDTLSILIDHTIAEQHRRLSPRQVCGMSQAVRVFPEDTASEVAHAHACESVVSTTAAKRASFEASHLLRLGLEHLAMARKKGLPLCPIATDRDLQAMDALRRGGMNDKSAALEILGVGDANVPEDRACFESPNGFLTGTACCIAMMDRLDLPGDICCMGLVIRSSGPTSFRFAVDVTISSYARDVWAMRSTRVNVGGFGGWCGPRPSRSRHTFERARDGSRLSS
jgi:hypothetical protein